MMIKKRKKILQQWWIYKEKKYKILCKSGIDNFKSWHMIIVELCIFLWMKEDMPFTCKHCSFNFAKWQFFIFAFNVFVYIMFSHSVMNTYRMARIKIVFFYFSLRFYNLHLWCIKCDIFFFVHDFFSLLLYTAVSSTAVNYYFQCKRDTSECLFISERNENVK